MSSSSHKNNLAGTFGIGRGTIGGGYSEIISGNGEQLVGFGKYQGRTYIAGAGTSTANLCYAVVADTSTVAQQWILPAPGTPTITVTTATTLTLGNGTYAVAVGTAGGTSGTCTATADATSRKHHRHPERHGFPEQSHHQHRWVCVRVVRSSSSRRYVLRTVERVLGRGGFQCG